MVGLMMGGRGGKGGKEGGGDGEEFRRWGREAIKTLDHEENCKWCV